MDKQPLKTAFFIKWAYHVRVHLVFHQNPLRRIFLYFQEKIVKGLSFILESAILELDGVFLPAWRGEEVKI